MFNIAQIIATELNVKSSQVQAAIDLLDEGATMPFIARYRKEATGGLDDNQLRLLEERLDYLRELESRRERILKNIDEQGKLTASLKEKINQTTTKTTLEDLYLPFKTKRRSKAQVAKEAGLEPLALALLADSNLDPELTAKKYLNPDKEINDVQQALEGAKQILMVHFAENAELVGQLRDYLWNNGIIKVTLVKDQAEAAQKFKDYFDYQEALNKIPSHRALAIFRGRNEHFLKMALLIDAEHIGFSPAEQKIADYFNIQDLKRPADLWLLDVVRWAWKVKLFSRLDLELKMQLRELAETEAINVFGENLENLLLSAPAGQRSILAIDPGLRTGSKIAIIDKTGKYLDSATVYPHPPQKQWDQTLAVLTKMVKKYQIKLIAIGNGTASRETDRLITDLIKTKPIDGLTKVMVSEAGASVYSASKLASEELSNLDVSIRGAVSIARRLQDPLAELVKIDPKAIGVGQYQHDVNQIKLAKALQYRVEHCVNRVGVNVNTASTALLQHVSGLSKTLAQNIVNFRDQNGPFKNRKTLMKVPRMGAKSFQQAAGFLRINQGDNPLDASAVHPEAYPLVHKMIAQQNKPIEQALGDSVWLKSLQPQQFIDQQFGLPTVMDIIDELDKPGRDPRGEFKTAQFNDGIETIKDLNEGMILEGVITNVTNFGAFVDIGVHQDGLVHISALADHFIKTPSDVVKAGQLVKVKVTDIDIARKRIALTMRLNEPSATKSHQKPKKQAKIKSTIKKTKPQSNNAMSNALAKAFLK